jgi:CDGSH-type Zn-finger protein
MKNNKDIKSQALAEVIEGGPLKITGNFILRDIKRDKESAPGEVHLCRCGKSSAKPYCDESHKTA